MPVLRGPNCTKRAAEHVWPLLCHQGVSQIQPRLQRTLSTRQQDSVPPKDGLDLRGAWLCHPTYPTT